MKRAALLLAFALGGCVSLLPQAPPAPRMFALEAARGASETSAAQPLDAVVAVAPPEGDDAALGTELVWSTGGEVAVVGGVKWATRADSALQTLLIETLARGGRLRAAARTSEARADYEIRWDVLEFQVVEEGGAAKARFSANAKLVDSHTRMIVAARIVASESDLASRSKAAAAEALTRAAQEGGARIASFVVESIETAQASAVSISR
jgi:cholesterol transport system auxiliary component